MSFFGKYIKEILLGTVMAAAGAVLFFGGAYMTGEKAALPAFEQKQEKEEERAPEETREEELSGQTSAEEDKEEPETVSAGTEKETEEPARPEMTEEAGREEADEAEKPETLPESSEGEENAPAGSGQKEEAEEKEEADPEAEKRREQGRFIGQIDALIAAEDAWNKYPGQIPEGYDARSGYTYDTYISKNPTREEPWYEITLCISNHRDDTIIDQRAIVDAYSGKVRE